MASPLRTLVVIDDQLTYCRLLGENAEKLCFLHDNLKLLIWKLLRIDKSGVSFHTNASTSVAVTNATSLLF